MKITREEFERQFIVAHPLSDITIIEYEGASCAIRCNKCGKIWKRKRAYRFIIEDGTIVCCLDGRCIEKINKQIANIEARVLNRFPETPIKILEYKGYTYPTRYLCLRCNTEHELSSASLFFGNRLQICRECYLPKTKQELLDVLASKETVTLLSPMATSTTEKLSFHCSKCNGDFVQFIHNFVAMDGRCPLCEHSFRNKEQTQELIDESYGNDHFSLLEYSGTEEKMLLRHDECGFIFSTQFYRFVRKKHGCPKCHHHQSHGERRIARWLEANEIGFERQYTGLDKHHRFDFFISPNKMIEYDGEQHTRAIDFFGGEDGFKQRKIKDRQKDLLCQTNNILLLRISYLEKDNIEQILSSFLNA